MHVPLFNDEGDPIVTWSLPRDFHNDIRYPAMLVKIIDHHFTDIMEDVKFKDVNYHLISNDNGFMTYTPNHFSQRTLTARFQVNTTGGIPIATYFIPKPAITAMGFLSRLHNNKLDYTTYGNYNKSEIGMILTTNDERNEFAGVIYNSADDEMDSAKTVTIHIDISAVISSYSQPVGILSYIDNNNGNPYKTWQKLGSIRYDKKIAAQALFHSC